MPELGERKEEEKKKETKKEGERDGQDTTTWATAPLARLSGEADEDLLPTMQPQL